MRNFERKAEPSNIQVRHAQLVPWEPVRVSSEMFGCCACVDISAAFRPVKGQCLTLCPAYRG